MPVEADSLIIFIFYAEVHSGTSQHNFYPFNLVNLFLFIVLSKSMMSLLDYTFHDTVSTSINIIIYS